MFESSVYKKSEKKRRFPFLIHSHINVFWINSSKYLFFVQTAYGMSPSSPTTRDWSICWSGEPFSASPTSSLSGLPNVLSARLQDVVSRTLRNGIKSCCMPKNSLSYLRVDSHRRCANMSLIKIIPTKTISESENNLLVVSVSPPPTPLKSQMKRRRTRRAQSTFIPETFNFDASQCNNQKVKTSRRLDSGQRTHVITLLSNRAFPTARTMLLANLDPVPALLRFHSS